MPGLNEQSLIIAESQDRIGATLRKVLRRVTKFWGAPQSDYPNTAEIEEKIRASFDDLLKLMQEREATEAGVDASSIDLVAVEVSRALAISYERPEDVNVRVFAGALAEYYLNDPYSGESNPFLAWNDDVHLQMQLFADRAALAAALEENKVNLNAFVTTAEAIESIDESLPLSERKGRLIALQDPRVRRLSKFPRRQLKDAAGIALLSTKNSRALMRADFTGPLTGLAEEKRAELERMGYPFTKRAILYVPVFIAGQSIGGAVFHSKEPISDLAVSVIDMVLHVLLYRVRSVDQIAAAKLAAGDKARWEATLLYVHRLAHDVQKPLGLARDLLRNIIEEQQGAVVPQLERLNSSLANLDKIIAGGAGIESVERLREQARRDARPDQLAELVEDSVWIWRLEAQKNGKRIEVCVPHPATVTIPRFLVVEVLENLVSNAVRAAHERIMVTAEEDRDRRTVTFTVSDDGVSVPQQIRSDSFVPYYATGVEHKGLGLQLSSFIVTELLGSEKGLSIDADPDGWTVAFEIPEVEHAV